MKLYSILVVFCVCLFLPVMAKDKSSAQTSDEALVFVGDTYAQVYEMLGDPNIEFPKDGKTIRWYVGYELTFSDDVVVAVKQTPLVTEEEKAEKALRAGLAEERLRSAYDAVSKQEKIAYDRWLERERKRRQDEREEKARIEAEKERKSKERRDAILANSNRHNHTHDVYIYGY